MSHRKKNFRFKPGERDHIIFIGEESGVQIQECAICGAHWPPPSGYKGRERFAFQYWMKEHIKCAKEPRHGEEIKCPVPEDRGVGHGNETTMDRTSHLLDRQVRHFPYKAAKDGRDYGRSEAIKDGARRRRQIGRAFCDEWPSI